MLNPLAPHMKTLIAIAIIAIACSLATPSVNACTNECWLGKNQDTITRITNNYADLWNKLHERFNFKTHDDLRKRLDSQCERGWAVTPEEIELQKFFDLVDCNKPKPTPTATPVGINVTVVPCWKDDNSRIRFIGNLAGLQTWVSGELKQHDSAGRVIVEPGLRTWSVRRPNGTVVDNGKISVAACRARV